MINEEFLKRMKNLLKDDFDLYLESLTKTPVKAFRINQNYISKEEFINNFKYDYKEIPYLKEGFYLFDNISGNSLIHQSGLIYFQEPSAMLPIECIDFKEDALCLDLCSSPGGKSLQVLSKIKNGFLIANEIDNKRIFALKNNLIRFGFSNFYILNDSPRTLEKDFKECFDYIITDVPCTGEGMFRKEESARDSWSLAMVESAKKRDLKIIDSAISFLKKDGYLIYSTCTFSKEENEDVCEYIKECGLKEMEVNDKIKEFTSPALSGKGRRFYPHRNYGEGQFMAVFKKEFGEAKEIKIVKANNSQNKHKLVDEFINKYLNEPIDYNVINDKVYYLNQKFDIKYSYISSKGILLGEIRNNYFYPEHDFFKVLGNKFKLKYELKENEELGKRYLKGEELFIENYNGYGVFTYFNATLGGFKAVNGKIKNLYPKSLRILNKNF